MPSFMKILPVGVESLHADRQMDREADVHDEAHSRFSQFCKRAKKVILFSSTCTIFTTTSLTTHKNLLCNSKKRVCLSSVLAPELQPTLVLSLHPKKALDWLFNKVFYPYTSKGSSLSSVRTFRSPCMATATLKIIPNFLCKEEGLYLHLSDIVTAF
jgi:hypothetical protein